MDQLKNFGFGYVSTAPTSADSFLTFKMLNGEASSFADPVNGAFNVTIFPADNNPLSTNAEIVRITAKSIGASETTFTITRQAETGGTSRTILAGDRVAAAPTKKLFTDLDNAITQKTFLTVGNSAGCDYVTDGTADNVEIQAAIDAVNTAGGGTVLVRKGSYSISAPIKMKSSVRLMGEGVSTILNLANTINNDIIACFDSVNGHDNIAIEGFKLDGNKVNNTTAGNGINIKNSRNVLIEKVLITGCKQHGINIDGALTEHVQIKDCTSYSNDLAGISLLDGIVRVLVDGNYCYSNGTANIAINGYGSYITITRNICKTSGIADNITGYNFQNNHVIVSHNQVFDGNNHGIHMAGNYITICNNQVYDTTKDGIFVQTSDLSTMQNCIISNNQIRSAGRYGIHINRAKVGSCTGNVIVSPNNSGIHFDIMTDFDISGNSITGSVTTDGIRVHRSSRNRITKNLCKNNARYGIYVSDDDVTFSLYNKITDNECYDDQATKTQDYGIFIANSADYTYMAGNTAKATDHTTGGIAVTATPTNNELAGTSDGWVEVGETWTFGTATTFTVSGDKTGKYQKGDKIRLKQGGAYKYFYILDLTYAAPNTTVTVTGGTDYTLVTGSITDKYFSKASTPQGFPQWFNWTPVWLLSGGTLDTTYTTQIGRLTLNGRTCTLHWQLTLGTVTTASANLPFQINFPINAVIAGNQMAIGSAVYLDSGVDFTGLIAYALSASAMQFFKGMAVGSQMGADTAKTVANNDSLSGTVTYQI